MILDALGHFSAKFIKQDRMPSSATPPKKESSEVAKSDAACPADPTIHNHIPMNPCFQTSSKRTQDSRRRNIAGFTLIELLAVIAVIAVLAALAFTTLSRMSTQSSQAKAVSNFRGLGAAIMTYAAENNQSLPGLQANHRCAYRTSSPDQIGSVLYQQMGLPAPTKVFQPVPLLTVPALKKWLMKYANGDLNGGAYTVTYQIEMPDGTKRQPFGWPKSKTPSMKMHQIPNPAKTWALYELGGPGDPNPFLKAKNFPEPIHGDKRTVLFFDGHVEVVPSSAPKPIY